ncbi:hypothetical protein SANTM175S_05371 [Streptomyces antimycoticus]
MYRFPGTVVKVGATVPAPVPLRSTDCPPSAACQKPAPMWSTFPGCDLSTARWSARRPPTLPNVWAAYRHGPLTSCRSSKRLAAAAARSTRIRMRAG